MTRAPMDKALEDPTLKPLAFAIQKGVASLEASLAAPLIEPELSGIIYEAETISQACIKLATELERANRAPGAAPDERIRPRERIDLDLMNQFVRGAEAAMDGRLCPACRGVVPTR